MSITLVPSGNISDTDTVTLHYGKYRGVRHAKVHLWVLVVVKQIKVADLVNIILI